VDPPTRCMASANQVDGIAGTGLAQGLVVRAWCPGAVVTVPGEGRWRSLVLRRARDCPRGGIAGTWLPFAVGTIPTSHWIWLTARRKLVWTPDARDTRHVFGSSPLLMPQVVAYCPAWSPCAGALSITYLPQIRSGHGGCLSVSTHPPSFCPTFGRFCMCYGPESAGPPIRSPGPNRGLGSVHSRSFSRMLYSRQTTDRRHCRGSRLQRSGAGKVRVRPLARSLLLPSPSSAHGTSLSALPPEIGLESSCNQSIQGAAEVLAL